MDVGVIKIADDEDFKNFIKICDNCDEDMWKVELCKKNMTVWTKLKNGPNSTFKMIKLRTEFKDISASTLYDVLHDSQYRKQWDRSMLEGHDICMVSPNSDIGYYSIRCMPFKCRDFVTQRSWLALGSEYLILNQSVNHQNYPHRKGYVRGISYLTGYLVRQLATSCQLTYITKSDPKGKLPVWAVNKVTQMLAPKVISRIHKAAKAYESWKDRHSPLYKPWLYPEQSTLKRFNEQDILQLDLGDSSDCLDETGVDESDYKEEDLRADDDI